MEGLKRLNRDELLIIVSKLDEENRKRIDMLEEALSFSDRELKVCGYSNKTSKCYNYCIGPYEPRKEMVRCCYCDNVFCVDHAEGRIFANRCNDCQKNF